MKTIALLLAASISLLSACATDEDSVMGGRPPLGKPLPEAETVRPDIEESFDLGDATTIPLKDFDDGRLSVETFGKLTVVHRFNEKLDIDEIGVLDEQTETVKCCFTLRGQVTINDVAGLK